VGVGVGKEEGGGKNGGEKESAHYAVGGGVPAGENASDVPSHGEDEESEAICPISPISPIEPSQDVRLGLGIDAGGTYTDVVLYDFASRRVIQKAKALTTKWDFTVGIGEALDALDASRLGEVDLVSLSTTLATNAIVEGRGQKVGLLIMPPYGLFDPKDIAHRPIAILAGKLEIDGTELTPVNDEQVRRSVRDMVDNQQVGAFAVAGYASHNNPTHELRVKQIVQSECGLTVTCGHDVSEGLNYRVRAATAALNARIIPCLDALLREMEISLERRGIRAARMVVKSDGSLMSVEAARRRPIETILSGPAASVAGASHLAGLADAIVVDVGGTTTDTATIEGGTVRICQDGASVGGWRTHVKALDMRTLGLGGDSQIVRQRRRLTVGPRRVAPVCWLAARRAGTDKALDWIERHVDYFDVSTRGADLLALNDHQHKLALTAEEARVVDLLRARPACAHELADKAGYVGWQFLPLGRLEEACIVDRSALTPTDALHVTGRVELWDTAAARRMCEVFAKLSGMRRDQFAEYAIRQVINKLAVELLKNQLAGQIDPDELDKSPAARALIENCLEGGGGDGDGDAGAAALPAGENASDEPGSKERGSVRSVRPGRQGVGGPGAFSSGVCRPGARRGGAAGGDGDGYRVRIALHRPIIGIGAPVHCFLPQAARLLQTRAIIPEHADVANAIGAIVSSVCVRKHVKVAPNEQGGYSLHGLPDAPAFANFEDAHRFAVAELVRAVRQAARLAGTRETSVEVVVDDRVADVADGSQVFVGRSLEARLTGRPDVARLVRSS
jgi:N-methylhydantoinase A/oxoprolinase/acetone carboxylase beta subunit